MKEKVSRSIKKGHRKMQAIVTNWKRKIFLKQNTINSRKVIN